MINDFSFIVLTDCLPQRDCTSVACLVAAHKLTNDKDHISTSQPGLDIFCHIFFVCEGQILLKSFSTVVVVTNRILELN